MFTNHRITGILLAGGKSSRMGTDKGLVKMNGTSMAERILSTLASVCDEVIIIANNDKYAGFGYPVYQDIIPDRGPMGGIYTGLMRSNTEYNVVVSCDIPLISKELLEVIARHHSDAEAVIPFMESEEPLCARYSKSAVKSFARFLHEGNFMMKDALRKLDTVHVDPFQIKGFRKEHLANINTLTELKELERILQCR